MMRSKRYAERAKLVDRTKEYKLDEAVAAIKKISDNKFDESITLDIQLGLRPGQSNEMIRGTVSLAHGSGKKVNILCFCKGDAAREAKEAGAEFVGAEELVEKIQKENWLGFDIVVSHPDMMREVSKLGRVLGPRGLMPSPKNGTVTPNVGKAVAELKAGRVEFKNDKTSGVHVMCGKLSFSEKALIENARMLLRAVRDARPSAAKGDYMKRVTIAPSQGPGFRLAVGSLG
ncbi:MAG: 50S ribosomal protein L1 [Candidatus Omnitrophota bacterium]|nr:50S ribosomal protein L1 [Candidatus Omnitrophota bacterium]